jgi:hypothetical protein
MPRNTTVVAILVLYCVMSWMCESMHLNAPEVIFLLNEDWQQPFHFTVMYC